MPRVPSLLPLAAVLAAALLANEASPADCYKVGAWNLENFSKNAQRGFPESTGGGPTYPPRTNVQYESIAKAIRDTLDAKVLVLNEVDGGRGQRTSQELDDLVHILGPSWRYVIGTTGGREQNQRLALLWDDSFASLDAHEEIAVPKKTVGGKDIFDRDPLAGRFTFLHAGQRRNDLVVVALHLASGQSKTKNHDAAMHRLANELRRLRGHHQVLPEFESDILVAGDLNANAFDDDREEFFAQYRKARWTLLAHAGNYPPTRLGGVPLKPRSTIDYILATLTPAELAQPSAKVWDELVEGGDFDAFRETYSDHFPVTVCVSIMPDYD